MPLFVAEFIDAAPILLDAATPIHACEMLEAHDCPLPTKLHEVPPGTFMAELWTADDDEEERVHGEIRLLAGEEIPNPANASRVGYAFEPLDATVEWLNLLLEVMGESDPPPAEEPAIEPKPEEPDHAS